VAAALAEGAGAVHERWGIPPSLPEVSAARRRGLTALLSPRPATPMTLNRGDKLRYLDKRRGSMPFSAHQHLHRRSMPVDERDLRAALPPAELSGLVRCTSYSPGQAHRESWASDSSDSVVSSGSDSDGSLYKVMLLGEHGVGKTSLARIFGGVEDSAEAEEAGEGAGRCGAPAGYPPPSPRGAVPLPGQPPRPAAPRRAAGSEGAGSLLVFLNVGVSVRRKHVRQVDYRRRGRGVSGGVRYLGAGTAGWEMLRGLVGARSEQVLRLPVSSVRS